MSNCRHFSTDLHILDKSFISITLASSTSMLGVGTISDVMLVSMCLQWEFSDYCLAQHKRDGKAAQVTIDGVVCGISSVPAVT